MYWKYECIPNGNKINPTYPRCGLWNYWPQQCPHMWAECHSDGTYSLTTKISNWWLAWASPREGGMWKRSTRLPSGDLYNRFQRDGVSGSAKGRLKVIGSNDCDDICRGFSSIYANVDHIILSSFLIWKFICISNFQWKYWLLRTMFDRKP